MPFALAATLLLYNEAAAGAPRWSVLVFGIGLIALYAISGLYHLPTWSPRAAYILSRFDVAMIQLFIAASYTPLAIHALDGAWRTYSLVIAWTIAIVGAGFAASPIAAPRWFSALAYLGFGWLGIVPLIKIADVLPWQGMALIALSGGLYTVGALIYARKRPDPWPHLFGFHELFHVLVVLAGAAHVIAIWRYTIPLASG